MFVHTLNSCYEFDLPNYRVRRVEGTASPTDRFGADEEWRTFTEVSDFIVGESIIITWPDGQPKLRDHTVTSTVLAIEEPWHYEELKTSST